MVSHLECSKTSLQLFFFLRDAFRLLPSTSIIWSFKCKRGIVPLATLGMFGTFTIPLSSLLPVIQVEAVMRSSLL